MTNMFLYQSCDNIILIKICYTLVNSWQLTNLDINGSDIPLTSQTVRYEYLKNVVIVKLISMALCAGTFIIFNSI